MSAISLVDRYARIYIRAALDQGYDRPTVLEYSGLRLENHLDDTQSFSFAELLLLSRKVKRLLQDEFCGLTKIGCPPGVIEMMLDLASSARTLEEALHKIFRFHAVLPSNIRFTLVQQGEFVAVQQEIAEPELDHYCFLSEWWILVMWSVASWLIGEKIECVRFEFPHAPQMPEQEYVRALGAPCYFSQSHSSFVFKSKYLLKPVIKKPASIGEYLFNTRRFGEIPGTTESIKSRLTAFLQAYFIDHKEFPLMEYAAKRCELNAHTLRRRLLEEDTSFNQIKDDIRRTIALNLLKDRSANIHAISLEAGFCDTSSFSRAVKKWTGYYPSQYREKIH